MLQLAFGEFDAPPQTARSAVRQLSSSDAELGTAKQAATQAVDPGAPAPQSQQGSAVVQKLTSIHAPNLLCQKGSSRVLIILSNHPVNAMDSACFRPNRQQPGPLELGCAAAAHAGLPAAGENKLRERDLAVLHPLFAHDASTIADGSQCRCCRLPEAWLTF